MNTKLTIPPEFDRAAEDERIAFVQSLWDRIARESSRVLVPDEHKRVLDERLDAHRDSPSSGRSWSEVRDELLDVIRRT